jgi:Rod binding domain-containing protein
MNALALTAGLLPSPAAGGRALSSSPGAPAPRTSAVPAEIRRAADGFESLFVAELLAPLEESASHLFGSGPEGRTIGGLFRQQLAASVASARPLGIANLIEKQLLARVGTPLPADSTAARRAAASYGKAVR